MASTGRTVSKHVTFKINNVTVVGVKSINGVGLDYDAVDVTALTEALKNALPGQADCTITVVGHLDNTATTGFHTVMSALNGAATPLALDIQVGVRSAWDAGEPQFGITASTTSGCIVTSYVVNIDAMEATAVIKIFGSTAPAWGTTAES